jgi:hypothetical protein
MRAGRGEDGEVDAEPKTFARRPDFAVAGKGPLLAPDFLNVRGHKILILRHGPSVVFGVNLGEKKLPLPD